jgi:ABC-type multidrug transport system fused ATPase/permease subunit
MLMCVCAGGGRVLSCWFLCGQMIRRLLRRFHTNRRFVLSSRSRQLLVIARALLDGAGVVICDEATAAIDAAADARIQRILRTDFAKATTLTVAHRLNTIMDSTHILVMDDGKAAEFDTPSNLLAKGGLFKDLVDKWEEEQEG